MGSRLLRTLVFVHRWLSIPFSLLFVMWFASGIVMHFVPFPALTEAERITGLATIDLADVRHGPAAAISAGMLPQATRIRLWQRSDGSVYVISSGSTIKAVHARNLATANIASADLAIAIAADHARNRKIESGRPSLIELADYDQWTVPNGLDAHRPLYRIALNDPDGTELYVSSQTGEILRDTTSSERTWNYAGSVLHWIYPTILRKNRQLWNVIVWWLSLLALFATISGVIVGVVRIKIASNHLRSPYRGWHAWHHWLGLLSIIFVSTWTFSGWLSMDHGQLFADGHLTDKERTEIIGTASWQELRGDGLQRISAGVREIEWFALGGQIYRRERMRAGTQHLVSVQSGQVSQPREYLTAKDINAATRGVAAVCGDADKIESGDYYTIASDTPSAPVYRVACGDVWYHVDAGNGAILEKLDQSRRVYRWLYRALHTLDLPQLMERPVLRTTLIVALCAVGFVLSITGAAIGWRRLKMQAWLVARRRSMCP